MMNMKKNYSDRSAMAPARPHSASTSAPVARRHTPAPSPIPLQQTTQTVTVQTVHVAPAPTSRSVVAPASGSDKERTLQFTFLLDVSGSMSGPRIDSALQGLESFYDKVLKPRRTSLLSTIGFNDEVKMLQRPVQSHRVDIARDVSALRDMCSGSTALYDAIATAIRSLRELRADRSHAELHRDSVYEMFVLTDGEDNCSKTTLEELAQMVASPGLPNFHLFIVGVGMNSSYSSTLRAALCKKQHCRYVDVDNLSDLRRIFDAYQREVVQRLVVTTTTTTTTTTSTRRAAAPATPPHADLHRAMSRLTLY